MGHFLTGALLGWNIDKIYFYPYGGYSKFNTEINKPLKEELLVLLAGPSIQIIFYIIVKLLFDIDSFFIVCHYATLTFNLLPIYPLDGGKLVNILLSYRFSYLKSYNLIILISIISLIILFILSCRYYYNFNIILIVIFLFSKILEFNKEKDYSYNKLLLERYLKKHNFKKYKIINNLKSIYRDKKHLINKETEKTALKKYFNRYY